MSEPGDSEHSNSKNRGSLDQEKKDKMSRACNMWGEKMNAYRILMGNTEGEIPLGRPECRWDDNIKMDLREMAGVIWTALIWLRMVIVVHGKEPLGSRK
jgi:hypothetical protein